MVAITDAMHEGEVIGANCASSFIATLEGEPGDSVTLHSGRIAYVWEASDQPITEYEWDAQTIQGIWPDRVIRAGSQRESLPHGFGQSVPGQAVVATVTFRYTRGAETEEHETEPFTFVCRNP
ncbi:MAG TPA: hypothetical protein VK928_08595 [Longimicrobiales bacterium]|nr:hypothetical protein [Longimicrobiales bacterium]